MDFSVRLQELSWEEVERHIAASPQVVLPVGATEHHGRQLPLGTDAYLALHLAELAAVRAGCLVAPPLWFGWSPHHMWLPGTISLRPETLSEVIADVCGALATHGVSRIVVLNGHRVANLPPLQIGCWHAQQANPGVEVVLVDLEHLAGDSYESLSMLPVCHADDSETSLMMHLQPSLMKDQMTRAQGADTAGSEGEQQGVVWFPPRPLDEIAALRRREVDGGTVAAARNATSEKGATLARILVDRLVEVLRPEAT